MYLYRYLDSTLFANLIALDHMYKEDYNDGTLLYYIVNKVPLVIVVYAKCLSHWLLVDYQLF